MDAAPQGWAKLRRQSTDLVSQTLPQMRRRSRSLWAAASAAAAAAAAATTSTHHKTTPHHAAAGSWQGIDDLPALRRSGHSLDVVAGAAYLFGGEVGAGQLADNGMHVVRLPGSGAGADYFCAPAEAEQQRDAVQRDTRQGDAEQEGGDLVQKEDSIKKMEDTTKRAEEKMVDDDDDVYATPDESASLASPTSPGSSKGKQRAAAAPQRTTAFVPPPRLGHATAVIGARIFLFGGTATAPLDEAGRVWVFDTRSRRWSHLDPAPASSPRPAPRAHHCAAATPHPRPSSATRPRRASRTWREWALDTPQTPVVGAIAQDAVDDDDRGYGTLFVHAGCLADGSRAADLWAFDVASRSWTQLPAAPGPGRVDAALCLSKSRLFRYGGSDGHRSLGHAVDFLPLELDTFDDSSSRREVAVTARPSGWQTIPCPSSSTSPSFSTFTPSSTSTPPSTSPSSSAPLPSSSSPDSPSWPEPRSAPILHALTLGGGRELLVLAMGAATSHVLADVWTFQVPPLAMSAASLGDALRQAVGRPTGDACWTRVHMQSYDDADVQDVPRPRSRAASAPMTDVEDNAIVLWGGVDDEGACLGDGWILRLSG